MKNPDSVPGRLLGSLYAIARLAVAAPAYANVSTYTDVDACESEDSGMDSFYFACEGPHGRRAHLHYVEGEAVIVYSTAGGGEVLVPFMVGGEGRVFGQKLEWRSAAAGSAPCAAILRVGTPLGSRLAVTDLDGSGAAPAFVATNEHAHEVADALCRGEAPRRMPWEAISKASLPDEMTGRYAPDGNCAGGEHLELSVDSVRLSQSDELIRFHGLDVSYSYTGDDRIAVFPRDESSPYYPTMFLILERPGGVELEIARGNAAYGYRLHHLSSRSLSKC